MLQGFVHFVGIGGSEGQQWLEDTNGCTKVDVRLIHQGFIPFEGDHAATDLDVVTTQLSDLFSQYVFQAHPGLGDIGFLFHFLALDWRMRDSGATSSVTQMLPPMVAPLPMVMRPSVVALE